MARVLRVSVGTQVSVFNGDGHDYSGHVDAVSKQRVTVNITSVKRLHTESTLHTCLALAVSKGDRFDWAIKKATELGVTSIVPILSQRVDVRLSPERWLKKRAHWQQVVISACEQSGRAVIPEVVSPAPLDSWVAGVEADCKYLLDPSVDSEETSTTPESVVVLIGPEGGFTSEELRLASQFGFCALRLGPRVLRTETAPLVALSVIGARWGDIKS
ncbi:MAG: 16S rRNA (uracil(1498)-N(3))-methyltransferase [Luminiphilus sp.]|nr:16S rRNA (uracil(1498)-N(3))-methyltransferase [Luminiphilus sp.]